MKLSDVERAACLAEIVRGLEGRSLGHVEITGMQGTRFPNMSIPIDLTDQVIDLIKTWALDELLKLGVTP